MMLVVYKVLLMCRLFFCKWINFSVFFSFSCIHWCKQTN